MNEEIRKSKIQNLERNILACASFIPAAALIASSIHFGYQVAPEGFVSKTIGVVAGAYCGTATALEFFAPAQI